MELKKAWKQLRQKLKHKRRPSQYRKVVKRDKKCTLHLFHTLDGISGTDVGYSSCLSSPPFFCTRLVFFCALIFTLFPYFFSSIPIGEKILTKKVLPQLHSFLCASCIELCEVKIDNTANSHNWDDTLWQLFQR